MATPEAKLPVSEEAMLTQVMTDDTCHHLLQQPARHRKQRDKSVVVGQDLKILVRGPDSSLAQSLRRRGLTSSGPVALDSSTSLIRYSTCSGVTWISVRVLCFPREVRWTSYHIADSFLWRKIQGVEKPCPHYWYVAVVPAGLASGGTASR